MSMSKTQIHIDHISKNEGQSGLWREQLTEEEISMFETQYAATIRQMGYDA